MHLRVNVFFKKQSREIAGLASKGDLKSNDRHSLKDKYLH